MDNSDYENPGARYHAVMTHDPDGEILYLFGGRLADGTTKADLWAFDFKSEQWDIPSLMSTR
ncbi:MAG: hypothetical protein JRC77_10720 [Deltaproteobacteria bacterium]|nr:hypothetical protein [Deltaproteobacteria bacterium]